MPVKAVMFDAYGTLLRNEDLMLIPRRIVADHGLSVGIDDVWRAWGDLSFEATQLPPFRTLREIQEQILLSVLRHALGDFRHQDSFAGRLGGDDTAFLAVVATAPREVGYGRLLLFSKSGQVVYDEILARSVTALTASDGGAGRQMLLLSGDGLWAYRK